MNRIYDENIKISSTQVQTFFEKRFNKNNMLASVMLRNSSSADIAQKRDDNEGKLIKSFIAAQKQYTALDIGCGCGRLVSHLQNNIKYYDGIDFTKPYIQAANELYQNEQNIQFYQMSATKLDKTILNKKYNLVLITGLCPYLNDDDVIKLFTDLNHFLDSSAQIYLRESISVMGKRLTLKDFPSEELETDYNAIYRTPEEYEELLKTYLPHAKISKSQLLLTKETGAREETNQKYWFLEYKV